jgi:hypothetical protein
MLLKKSAAVQTVGMSKAQNHSLKVAGTDLQISDQKCLLYELEMMLLVSDQAENNYWHIALAYEECGLLEYDTGESQAFQRNM